MRKSTTIRTQGGTRDDHRNHVSVSAGRQYEELKPSPRTAEMARYFWENSSPVTCVDFSAVAHYFVGLEVRQHQTALVIPIHNVEGEIINLLRIYPDGAAWLLGAGKVTWRATND